MTKPRNSGQALGSSFLPDERQMALFDDKVPPPLGEAPVMAISDSCKHCEETYLSVDEVAGRYSVSRATIWRWVEAQPNFAKPVKLSPEATRWKMCDLAAFEAGIELSGS